MEKIAVILAGLVLLWVAKKIKSVLLMLIIAAALIVVGLQTVGDTMEQHKQIQPFQEIFK